MKRRRGALRHTSKSSPRLLLPPHYGANLSSTTTMGQRSVQWHIKKEPPERRLGERMLGYVVTGKTLQYRTQGLPPWWLQEQLLSSSPQNWHRPSVGMFMVLLMMVLMVISYRCQLAAGARGPGLVGTLLVIHGCPAKPPMLFVHPGFGVRAVHCHDDISSSLVMFPPHVGVDASARGPITAVMQA